MATTKKKKLLLPFLLFLALFLRTNLATESISTDPELKQCKHQCQHLREASADEKQACNQRCEQYYRAKKGIEKEKGQRGHEQGHERKLGECLIKCEKQQEGEEREHCRFLCQQRSEKARNPYVFEEKQFEKRSETEHGRIYVLEKFSEISKLLVGIENYRVGFLVTGPYGFVLPSHWDADAVLFVAHGEGVISMTVEDKRMSFKVERGDMIRVCAGSSVYMFNRNETEQLYIVKLLVPVNVPGQYEAFYGAGGQNPESFYNVFSPNILEAALQTPYKRLESLFRQQDEGGIIKASKEEIKAMSKRTEDDTGSIWPFKSKSKAAFNLFEKSPSRANEFGQIFEAMHSDYKPLQDLNLILSFVNITKGSIYGPFYESRATDICFVTDGQGYLEMACPHLSSSSESESSSSSDNCDNYHGEWDSGPTYHKISGHLKRNTVFIVPAGHPVVILALQNNHLQFVCFQVKAQDNIKYSLAGKGNIISSMEKEAKKLSFKENAQVVDQIFGNQTRDLFFPGPKQEQYRADM